MPVTLVASRNLSPKLAIPFENQVPTFGSFSPPSGIISYPDTPFAINFSKDTFSDPATPVLNYYAAMDDNTPLPAWISFDPGTLAFAGRTPSTGSLVQPPETFSFQLMASDVVGFSASSLPFSIVVGSHELTSKRPVIELNATIGSELSYNGLVGDIMLDGKPATPESVNITATLNLPAWLTLDHDTWDIKGQPPASANSTNITIIFQDVFLDTLNVTMSLTINEGLFKSQLPLLNVTAGTKFRLDLRPYLLDPDSTDVSIDANHAPSWVQLDVGNESIFGTVPSFLASPFLEVRIIAHSKLSAVQTTEILILRVFSPPISPSATMLSTTPIPSTAAPESTSAVPTDNQQGGDPSLATKLLAVLVPIIILSLALLSILLCGARRRKARKAKPLQKAEISGPVPGSFVHVNSKSGEPSLRELSRQPTGETSVARSSISETNTVPPIPPGLRNEATRDRPGSGGLVNHSTVSSLLAAAAEALHPLQRTKRSKARQIPPDASNFSGDTNDDLSGPTSPLPLLGKRSGQGDSFRMTPVARDASSESPLSIQSTPDHVYSTRPAKGKAVSSQAPSSTRAAIKPRDRGAAPTGRPHRPLEPINGNRANGKGSTTSPTEQRPRPALSKQGTSTIRAVLPEDDQYRTKGRASGRQDPRDPLGISYQGLVDGGPFHPSRTWSTISSGRDMQDENKPDGQSVTTGIAKEDRFASHGRPNLESHRAEGYVRSPQPEDDIGMAFSRYPGRWLGQQPSGGNVRSSKPYGARASPYAIDVEEEEFAVYI